MKNVFTKLSVVLLLAAAVVSCTESTDIDFTDSSDDGSCLVGVSADNMFTGHYTAANGSGGKYKMMNRYFANGDTDAAPSNEFYESGVFGYLGQGAVVEDLIVENFYLHLGMATGWYAADYGSNAPSYSLLIAHAVGATIQNIEITGSEIDIHKGFGTKGVSFDVVNKIAVSQLVARGFGVSINSTYPGLATTHNTLIKDCAITKSGDVGKILSADQTTATTGYSALGSVLGVGLGYVEVNGCTSNIEIGDKGTCGTGGIGGYGGTYIDCHFTGDISKAPIYVGGIVGYYEVSTAENIVSCCSSSGTISWSEFFGNYIGIMGGIVGRVENLYTPGATALIDQCYSSMTITNDGRSTCNAAFGGILGGISNAATILTVSNCYFEGSLELSSTSTVVKGSFHTAAGIVGEFVGTSNSETQFMNIENCYSVGDIVGAYSGSYSFIQATILGLATTSWLANADVSASTLSDGKTIKNCFGLDTSMTSSQTGVAVLCSDYVGAFTDESTGNGIKTAAELKTASTFAEYDTSIWSITNGSYPTLINNPAR